MKMNSRNVGHVNGEDHQKDGAIISTPEECNNSGSSKLDVTITDALNFLESFVDDPTKLLDLSEETKNRLFTAAGIISRPCRSERRRQIKTMRLKRLQERKTVDKAKCNQTGIRKLRAASVFVTPTSLFRQKSSTEGPGNLAREQKCYICKSAYSKIHFFYDRLCEPCAKLNYQKRFQTADLSGRIALVTGGRVKIGYQTVIKLLRSGARVVVTTRFPKDAAQRYSAEEDFHIWRDRLEIFGVDFRHTPSVEIFAQFLNSHLPRLDFIIHNACQTIRRPTGFYKHLLDLEQAPNNTLSNDAQCLLGVFSHPSEQRYLPNITTSEYEMCFSGKNTFLTSAELTQIPLTHEDSTCKETEFPLGKIDQDKQQVDLRHNNSWRYTLHEVPTIEVLEVHLVNAIAPFVLNAKLKLLMLQHRTNDKHIVNVSAMEGQFYRKNKTDRHPHTNMAKAALNMMTRTSAIDFAKDGIHMNSVDTGWVTEENPIGIAEHKRNEYDFQPPLDIVDGASRVLDPIFNGFITGEHQYGCFLKDYKPTAW